MKVKQPGKLKFLFWNLKSVRLHRTVRAVIRSKTAFWGILFVFIAVGSAIFAPILAPHDPYKQNLRARIKPPVWIEGGSRQHFLGTDQLGRDMLSRLMYGARVSMSIAGIAVIIASVVGLSIGLLSGFYGGWVDSLLMGFTNIFMSFPYILLAIALMAVIGPGYKTLVLVLGLCTWPIYARLVRSEVLRIKEFDFVEAARALGVREGVILVRHIMRNVLNSLIVTASLEVARQIINEAFFSFIGLGVQVPVPSWGSMLYEGKAYIFKTWWLVSFPGAAIFMTTLGINLLGDWLRDVLDPHMVF